MKRLNARQSLLGGALVLGGAVLAFDHFTTGGEPRAAQASTTPAATAVIEAADWQQAHEIVERLTENHYTSVADELNELSRDLFLPTDAIDVALQASTEQVEPPEEVEARAKADEFRARHQLTGVIVGQSRLAVIGERVLPLGSELDGYLLIEIERDSVVFSELGEGRRITLNLAQGPKKQ